MRYKQHKLLEQNLTSLENYIQQNNLDITPEYMIHCITEADPDQHQFKNSKWLIKNLLENKFLWEDIETGNESKAFDTLNRFLNIRKQWPESDLRDINQYVGLSGIAEKIRPFEITKGMNELKREEKAKIYEDTIVLYDKDDYLVVIPKTQEASCFWGRNTEWCTASTKSANYFDYYNKDGPLIICITPDNKKYQFHKDSEPMDENDREIEDITDPMLIQLAILTGKLSNISEELRTKELCEMVVKQDGRALEFVPWKLKNQKLCEISVQQNGRALHHVPEEFKTQELCKTAVQQDGYALQFIPEELRTQELCEMAVQQNGMALRCIPKQLRIKKICEIAIQQDGRTLQFVPEELQTSELCGVAIKKDGNILQFVPRELQTPKLCKLAIQQNGRSLQYVPIELRTKELCEMAVQQNGMALQYVPIEFRIPELCEMAVKQNGWTLQFVPEDLITPALCELAVQQNSGALCYVPIELKTQELCELAIQQLKTSTVVQQPENNNIPQEINDPKWLENKEYEVLQNHLDNFILPDNKLSVSLHYA